jgi:hypothetical protein
MNDKLELTICLVGIGILEILIIFILYLTVPSKIGLSAFFYFKMVEKITKI